MTEIPGDAAAWRAYLSEYGAAFLRTAEDYQLRKLTAEQCETHWLGPGPAGEQTIAATEARLGTRLPPSLRTFLSVTDGWYGVGGWIELVHPCREIDWLRNTASGEWLIELYSEADRQDELADLFRNALMIAGGEDLWLLDPTDVRPDGEWAAHEFEPKYGEVERYADFSALFHASMLLMTEEG